MRRVRLLLAHFVPFYIFLIKNTFLMSAGISLVGDSLPFFVCFIKTLKKCIHQTEDRLETSELIFVKVFSLSLYLSLVCVL